MTEKGDYPSLRWRIGDATYCHKVCDDELILGRKPECDLVIEDGTVSRRHATLTIREGTYYLTDLDSSFGTNLNGKTLKAYEENALSDGATFSLGKIRLTFSQNARDTPAEPVAGGDDLPELKTGNPAWFSELEEMRLSLTTYLNQMLGSSHGATELKNRLDQELGQFNDFVAARFKEYEVLQEVTQIIVGILDLRELLSTVLKLASRVLRADRGFILLYDPVHKDLRSMVTRHFERENYTAQEHDFSFSQTIARNCFETKELVVIDDAMVDARFASAHSIMASSIRSVVCLPLIKGEQVSGVLYLDNLSTPGCFSDHQLSFLKAFAAQTALALDNARLYTQAVTDGLTKLYNRKFIDERIAEEMVRSRRYGRACSVILIDVDFFKKVNDTYGHHAGDVVLQEVADKLAEQARGSDIVARYGGEEFLMLLTETDHEGARVFAERLRQTIEEMVFDIDKKSIKVTISCGVTAYRPDFRSSVQAFVNEADQGLYRAKQTGRNRVCSMIETS